MKINFLDLIGSAIILISLYLVTLSFNYWLLYALGCGLYIILHYKKQLYFGMIMNIVAVIIAISNFFRG